MSLVEVTTALKQVMKVCFTTDFFVIHAAKTPNPENATEYITNIKITGFISNRKASN